MKIRKRALTFEDVLLVPQYSEVLPKEVSLESKLTRNISLKIPMVSAAMDTVTEFRAAIAMARLGGIGIIHKNMDIETQCKQVKKVKKSESGVIIDPIYVHPDATLADANALMNEFKISGVPVIDTHNKLLGILTNRDMRFEKDMTKRADEVMTKMPLITANKEISLDDAADIMHKNKIGNNLFIARIIFHCCARMKFLMHANDMKIFLHIYIFEAIPCAIGKEV